MTGLRDKPLRGFMPEVPAQAAITERYDTHTSYPGEVVSFDPETQTATIKVLHVPKIFGEEFPMPDLIEVPVKFWRGGGFALTFPVKKGDPGEIRFASRNMDAWRESGEAKPADSNRMHDLSDAYFIPGGLVSEKHKIEDFSSDRAELRSIGDAPAIRVVMGGLRVVVRKGKFVQLKASTSKTGAAEMHFTIDLENTRILASHDIDIGPDPNPAD